MKKLFGLILVILTLIAYNTDAQSKEVIIPDSIAELVIKDLIRKDYLEYTVSNQDSLIKVYEIRENHYHELIASYKLNEEQYKLIITNLEKVNEIRAARLKDLEKQHKKAKFKTVVTDVVQYAVIGILVYIILLTK